MLRRRVDRPAQAELDRYLSLQPWLRTPVPPGESSVLFGAADSDVQVVSDFLVGGGLRIVSRSAARRTIVASGSPSQMRELFSVELLAFALDGQTYVSYSGWISVPAELSDTISCVFGLDTRVRSGRNQSPYPYPENSGNTVQAMMQYYKFPTGQGSGQLIVLVSNGGGFNPDDLTAYFESIPGNLAAPNPTTWPGTTPGAPDTETTQDVCIAATVAPGADFAVCYVDGTLSGWDAALSSLVPDPGEGALAKVPDVVSISYPIYDDDNPDLPGGPARMDLNCFSSRFQDLAAHHVTVCVTSGDYGVSVRPGAARTGKQEVQYPASDPWVLACGGTVVCVDDSTDPFTMHEYIWNDTDPMPGATGGGVSSFFACPIWQQTGAGLPPVSRVDGQSRRGVPDIAANGAFGTGYTMYFNVDAAGGPDKPGAQFSGNGTSAAAPLCAGLFAVLNELVGLRLGFVTLLLYLLASGHDNVCNQVPDPSFPGGPQSNAFSGLEGYPAQAGWDACTGLGTIDGTKLYNVLLREAQAKFPEISPWRPRL